MQRLLQTALVAVVLSASSLAAVPAHAQAQVQSRGLPDFADLVDKVGPAVVNIRTTQLVVPGAARGGLPRSPGGGADEDNPLCELFPWMCPPNRGGGGGGADRGDRGERTPPTPRARPAPDREQSEEVPSGVGSGFILSADGYIMTNAHVVRGADDIYVKMTDKREFKAKLIGADARTDVAIIKVEASGLPAVAIGDSERLRVGEWVLAIGSPFDLDNTVTAGIVSAKGRDTGEYVPFIQTDVAINPGNSGGPLINMKGEVVGINSMIYSRSGGYQGIAFAIPIIDAIRVGDQLKSSGKVTRGFLGVQPGAVTKEVAESLGLPKPQGAVVEKVLPGFAAEKAGLKDGDVILKFDGKAVEKHTDLPRIVGNTKPGQRVVVQFWRNGATREINLTLGEMEPDKPVAQRGTPGKGTPKKEEAGPNILGLVVSDLTEVKRKELGIDGGVQVDSVEGGAARANLRPGDLILKLQNTDVTSVKQFNDLVAKLDPKKIVAVLVRRGETAQYVTIRPDRK
ncbi:MAG TPA: DegQ family serine endoprotease [Burkholderiales bacterium]|jgi:serine protease Do|nr:DegQ family serine endoprotease [Burkholderiales bacterium]